MITRDEVYRTVSMSMVSDCYREADRDDAIVMVRSLDHDDRWLAVVVPAECLGSFDDEADWIAAAFGKGNVPAYRSPVIVLHDPRFDYDDGCSTNSHWDADEWDTLDRHADCEHELAAAVIAIVKGN